MMIKNIIENRNYHYELILRKPDKTPVAFIVYENLNFTRNFNDSSSLLFSTPKYFYNQKTGENYINPVWEQIKQGWIVELQAWDSNYIESGQIVDDSTTYPKRLVYDEYFTVEQPDLSASADSNNKSVNCVSRYQTVFNKVKLRGFDDTRKLFDCQFDASMNVVLGQDGYPIPISYNTSDFTQGGIVNYILENILPGWTVAYYDKNLINIGQPAVVPTYDIDFFTGEISYVTDSENHEILITGLSTYWTSGGDGYDLWSSVLSTNTSINPILLYLDGTEKDAEQYIASVNNLMQTVDIPTLLSGENVNAIMAEPLKGLELMNKSTTMLSEMRGYLTDLYSYQYSSDEVGTSGIFPQEVETYIALVDELCEKILDNFYSSLFYVYSTATGKFPYRTLKFDNSNLTDVFKSLQESFLCVFEFDSKNQLVYIYGRDNSAVDKDQTLIISPDNYMTDIQYQAKTDQVVTRLYVAGKDNLWCTDYNPTGQRYVDDFSYFTQDSTNGMSAELTAALARYSTYVSAHQDDLIDVTVYYYDSTNNTYPTNTVYMQADKIVNKIAQFSTQVAEAQQIARAFWLAEGEQSVNSDLDDTEDANTKITPAQTEAVNLTLDNLNAQFTQIVDFSLPGSGQENLRRVWMPEYDKPNESTTDPNTTSSFYLYVNMYNYQQALLNWQEQFLYENATDSQGKIFTDELLEELANYVYEEDITFENITDGKTLYNYAKDYLQYINNIPVSINIGLVDILSNYQYQMDWSKITDVGAKIHIEFKDFNLTLNNSVFKIMNYTHSISPNSQDLTITLSNNYELQNDYNKNLIDVWAESYKQVQDINTYRKTWEDFIAKQEQMLLQGQQIRADVNSIVDSAGKTVIDGKGLVLSKSNANTLRPNADGMYSRDKSIASTKTGTGYVANEQLFPDHIVFQDADMSYSTGTDGTTTLTVAGVGGGSGGGTAGLPRYYTAPYFSQKLQALDIRNGTSYITTNESGQSCIYYMEADANSTSGGKLHYYMAVLTASVDASAVNGFATVQFTDNAGRNMYYAVNNNVVDYNTLVYTTTTAPVMIYAATLIPTFEIVRSANHVPDITFGVGDGAGRGIYKVSKNADSGTVVYTSRTTGATIGVKLADDGVYYTQDGANWYLIGSGSAGGNVKIIDHAPIEADLTGENTVFARYDPSDTPVLSGTIGTLFNALSVYVEQPVIAAVTISPSSASVKQGYTQQFTANVAVTWTVTGNTSSGTSIDANGLLTVGNDEDATNIFVTARSTVDTSKYASVEVDVTETSRLFLFDNGVSEASGGWKLQGIYEEGYPPGTYVSYSIGATLNITIQRNMSNCYLETENLIDLTGYTKICAICDVYIDADAPHTSANRQQNLFYANANNQIVREVQHEEWGSPSRTINNMYLEMQLLGTTGAYHVGVGGAHGEVLNFKQVWLE